jgi:F-type H+-transporting ATPase subunit alpha
LHRGERLTEILKQGQYEPLPVEKQILIIFAGTNGFLDDLAVSQCRVFEKALYAYLDRQTGTVLDKIREKKALDDSLRQEIKDTLTEFKKRFASQHQGAAAN